MSKKPSNKVPKQQYGLLIDFSTEAKQSPTSGRLQDLNYELVRRGGLAMQEGREKYEGGQASWDKNYEKGDIEFAYNRLHNLIRHAFLLKETYKRLLSGKRAGFPKELDGQPVEDHLGHMVANLNMLAWYENAGVLPTTDPSQMETDY